MGKTSQNRWLTQQRLTRSHRMTGRALVAGAAIQMCLKDQCRCITSADIETTKPSIINRAPHMCYMHTCLACRHWRRC
jgi:hypothetical protein